MSIRTMAMPKRVAAAIALVLSTATLAPMSAAHAETTPTADDPVVITEDLGNASVKLTIILDKQAPQDTTDGVDAPAVSDEQVKVELAKLNDVADVASAPVAVSGLSAAELDTFNAPMESAPEAAEDAVAPMRQDPGGGGGSRAVLKCYDNRSWSDARGTFYARHNCAYDNINWGYKISPAVQAIISSNVNETGLRWWKNSKSQPANSPHVVGKSYLFHGTMGKVNSWDAVDYQDYMTFAVNVGGRPGRGSLAFAGGLVPVRG